MSVNVSVCRQLVKGGTASLSVNVSVCRQLVKGGTDSLSVNVSVCRQGWKTVCLASAVKWE